MGGRLAVLMGLSSHAFQEWQTKSSSHGLIIEIIKQQYPVAQIRRVFDDNLRIIFVSSP